MAYSEFTLRDVLDRFHLTLVDVPDLFGGVAEVQPSEFVQTLLLQEFLPLALAINTEKARSEYVVAPLLADLRRQLNHRISVFSGIDFNVDAEQRLVGYCDFILSASPEQQFLTSPVVTIVEAKNDNINNGLGQCVAATVAARLFNEREGRPRAVLYGAVTTGSLWRFLRLEGPVVSLDQQEYHIRLAAKVIGILTHIMSEASPSG
jgi:hypothetical protein